MSDLIEGVEYLEVRWNDPTDYDIHFKRFRRMGALLEWVEHNPCKVVSLVIYNKKDGSGINDKPRTCRTERICKKHPTIRDGCDCVKEHDIE